MVKQEKNEEVIFNAAIQFKSRDERDAYLAETCSGDKKLRAEVEALLKAHYEGSSLLDVPVFGAGVTLGDSALSEGPGTRIGRYKLLQLIGEGGFACVYMAEQAEPVRRKVALKIIKLGMDTKQVIGRFEAERQALAMMDHPNIAKVFDGGATDTGRPYFVMELVKGIPITEYCDDYNFDTRGRLELFVDTCRAVQHAHQKGIIHRDIKPSNVMVTLRDGRPVPKVIDFGIAKAMQQRLTERTVFTEYRQFIGTPEYMSPEQAQFSELDIDTRSDIYSLGVLLYELLTGTTPFERKELLSGSYDEMLRIIRETDPLKPSTRVSALGDALADVAKHRHAEPAELCKIISGDLDWVVMKTLEKDRTRRYETANELAMDIERHLSDEPVSAGPPRVGYRLRKFVRRHRTSVVAGLLVAAALVIGLCLALIGFIQASRQRDLTEVQRQRASVNFKMARDAVDEMTRVAKEQLTDVPGTKKVRRQLLQKAQVFYAGFVEENREDPAALEEIALAYEDIGIIHAELGNISQAREAFGEAIELLERLTGEFPDEPEYRSQLADCWGHYSYTFIWTHQRQEMAEGRRKVVALLEELVVDFPGEPSYLQWLASAHTDLGNALEDLRWEPLHLRDASVLKEAEMHHRKSIAILEKLYADFPEIPKDLENLAHCHHWLGAHLLKTDQLEEAEQQLRQALSLREQLLAEEPDSASKRGPLAHLKAYFGNLLARQGKVEEAEKEFREAITIREKLREEFPSHIEHRRRLGWLLYNLGTALMDRGLVLEGEDALRQGIAYFEKLAAELPEIAGFRWDLAHCLVALGEMLAETGQLEKAVLAYRRAIESREKLVSDFPDVPGYQAYLAERYSGLGDVLSEMGRLEEAEEAYRKAEEIEKEDK